MEEKAKKIAAHHDEVVRIEAKFEILREEANNFFGEVERDFLYLKSYRNRIIDMTINNCDRFIDLEIFLLKVFIPILSISFAAGVNIFGIDTHTLKMLSLGALLTDILLLIATFLVRTKIIASEDLKFKQELNSFEKKVINKGDSFKTRINQLIEDFKQAKENEPNSE